MKYIIMCGGSYAYWNTPKQLTKLDDETILERTIRLLRENGVEDIAISANNPIFRNFGVEYIEMGVTSYAESMTKVKGHWVDGFYLSDEPKCYILGDVIFSPKAIKTIVQTETDDIEFFASAPPFPKQYHKKWAEPFAFKVVNTEHFANSVDVVKKWQGWKRHPIAWELWQVIKGTTYNEIDYTNYIKINDYTCDIDRPEEVQSLGWLIDILKTEKLPVKYMIHACPKRMWYVDEYLVPSLLRQGIDNVNITVYNDSKGLGNLKACMEAFSMVDDNEGATWHLQDDVCVCKDFKKRTEELNHGIVCGYSTKKYDENTPTGWVKWDKMCWSFPCIRIPNQVARNCAHWVTNYLIGNPCYKAFWQEGVNDDWCFKSYIKTVEPDIPILNLKPNLVDHIDYLLGGGTRKQRTFSTRSQYWEDEDVTEALEASIMERSK